MPSTRPAMASTLPTGPAATPRMKRRKQLARERRPCAGRSLGRVALRSGSAAELVGERLARDSFLAKNLIVDEDRGPDADCEVDRIARSRIDLLGPAVDGHGDSPVERRLAERCDVHALDASAGGAD